ncbi:MAG TPA: hypothetical protein VFM18_18310 [Methanosarcina sp.]|nr:hypothetical protein [Methanosarcina sp.]
MKVNIGPYKNWIGPYQIASFLFAWVPKDRDEHGFPEEKEWIHNFGKWLAGGDDGESWLLKLCQWVESKRKRKIKIRIDKYDTWSMDHTLALIALPMLKQLKETKHGAPFTDMEDVPEHLRNYDTEEWDSQYTFDWYQKDEVKKEGLDMFARWDWIMSEMIWAFEQIVNDENWMDQYKIPCATRKRILGEDVDYTWDWDKIREHEARIANGLRLFGRYYQNLWD